MNPGISIYETSLGIRVFRLHYSSDPDKSPLTEAGKAWVARTKRGMSEARWAKEYEIDFGAMSGRLCFPIFNESLHFVDDFELDQEHWFWWMACDPSPARSHGFVWLAANAEGDLIVPCSWCSTWEPKDPREGAKTIKSFYAPGIRLIEESLLGLKKPIRRVMDPSGKGMKATEEMSMFDAYRQEGIAFQAAKKNRDYVGFDLINQALELRKITIGNEVSEVPRLRIFRAWTDVCNDNNELVWQLGHTRYAEWHGNVIDKDPPEKPEEKRKDLVDCLSYILLERPRRILRKPGPQLGTIYENLNY